MRRFSLASLVALTALALPSEAGAATQIGETFPPLSFTCSPNTTSLQSEPPGVSSAAPIDGLITQWSFQAGDIVPTGLKLKVGQVGATSLTIVGESSPENPAANQLNTYSTKVTVHAGDVIGFYHATAGRCGNSGYYSHGFAEVFAIGDILPGGTGSPITTEKSTRLDVSALLETDCDKDGLGDETQDANLSTCGPGTTGPGNHPLATCKGKPATIVGTNGNDTRIGSLGPDVIVGLGGNDTLSGLAGNDVICGGSGKDILKGGKGNDKLYGEAGKDTLKGGPGNDTLKGGAGKDKQIQ